MAKRYCKAANARSTSFLADSCFFANSLSLAFWGARIDLTNAAHPGYIPSTKKAQKNSVHTVELGHTRIWIMIYIVDMGNALGFRMGDWLSSLANSWSHREVYDPFVSACRLNDVYIEQRSRGEEANAIQYIPELYQLSSVEVVCSVISSARLLAKAPLPRKAPQKGHAGVHRGGKTE